MRVGAEPYPDQQTRPSRTVKTPTPLLRENTSPACAQPGGEVRGGHAFIEQKEMIVALSGSLDIIVFDGLKEQKFTLNRSYQGLYIPNGLWRHMENFATNTLVLVISNTNYNENDYIRNKKSYIDENISI